MLSNPPADASSTEVNALADRLVAEMRDLWLQGKRPLTEDFLSAHPGLRNHPAAVGELIYEEVSLRREFGEAGGSAEVLARFPQWAVQLRVLLNLRDTLDVVAEPDYPTSGQRLGEFDLLAELGRGRRGRVYLARQSSLADRPVVLKFTPRADAEHHTLARLQHTNIVPLYASHDDAVRRLRVLCMPFFGGATLAHIFDKLSAILPAERTPAAMWAALQSAPGNDGIDAPPPAWATDYTRVIAQIGARLADALQFAHERHLVHMDVKPSNVLFTVEGLPMLLDFHLARAPVGVIGPPPLWLGGTPAYQSPEQGDALDAIRMGRLVPAPVDGRSDIFSLGVMLYEALAGELPKGEPVPLWRVNPRVSRGLSDIISQCLATDARDRYPEAAVLAEDLRRHLADLPMRGVRNRSLRERWQKWRRRRPHSLVLLTVSGLLLGAILFAAVFVDQRRDVAFDALNEGNSELARGRFTEARGAFRRGLAVAESLPMLSELSGDLSRGLRQSELAVACGELHRVAEGMRAVSVAEVVPPNDLAKAEQLGFEMWARRTELFALAKSELPAGLGEQAKADLLEVILVWSRLRVQLSRVEQLDTRRRAALDILSEVERGLGQSAGVSLERAELARSLGWHAEADTATRLATAATATSVWHHMAVGNHLFRRGAFILARAEFERATIRDPRSFWARMQLGRCDLALGHPDDALLSFAVCVGIDPDNPAGYVQQGLAHLRLGKREKAQVDVDRALALDPANPQARSLSETLRRTP